MCRQGCKDWGYQQSRVVVYARVGVQKRGWGFDKSLNLGANFCKGGIIKLTNYQKTKTGDPLKHSVVLILLPIGTSLMVSVIID